MPFPRLWAVFEFVEGEGFAGIVALTLAVLEAHQRAVLEAADFTALFAVLKDRRQGAGVRGPSRGPPESPKLATQGQKLEVVPGEAAQVDLCRASLDQPDARPKLGAQGSDFNDLVDLACKVVARCQRPGRRSTGTDPFRHLAACAVGGIRRLAKRSACSSVGLQTEVRCRHCHVDAVGWGPAGTLDEGPYRKTRTQVGGALRPQRRHRVVMECYRLEAARPCTDRHTDPVALGAGRVAGGSAACGLASDITRDGERRARAGLGGRGRHDGLSRGALIARFRADIRSSASWNFGPVTVSVGAVARLLVVLKAHKRALLEAAGLVAPSLSPKDCEQQSPSMSRARCVGKPLFR